MKDEIQRALDDMIAEEIANVSELDSGSEEKTKAVNDLTKLYNLKIEEARMEQIKLEKRQELKTKAKDRWINVGMQVGLALVSVISYDIWYRRGLRFEIDNTVGSPMTRNLISRMLPGKK